ncbi:hypothetical protein V6Z12_D08G162600 [Gossypium hirsutum]
MASSNTHIPVDDGFNEYESALKCPKSTTSKVWDEMTKLKCENKNELKAQCNHCKTIFSAKSSSGTSHLRRHLNSYLKKVNKDITQYTIATQPSPRVSSSYFYFLAYGKHSFRTVEEPRFRYMMRIASPNFNNISRHTTARDVLMYYAKERDRVKEELAKAPGLICLTSDNWNSEHTDDEYICITAHWVDKDWKLQKRIIRFRALFPPYDGLNIADELVLCLSQWGIDKKIFNITLDNASYNDVMVSYLKNCFRASRAILCDSAFFKLDEWRNVAILCNFLKVFYDVTCVFSDSNYQMANLYFRGVWKVHKVLLDTVKGPYSFLTPMVKQMQEKFNKYWAEYSLILSCAAILDPHFVGTILSNLRLLFDEYVKKSKSTSSSLAGSSNVSDKNLVDSGLDEHNVNSANFGGYFDESDDYKRYLNESSTRSEQSQLDIYLEEPELELNSQIDVLDYWSKSSVQYSELSLLAHDILAIPISTVASESAFSMGKKVITPLKSSLKPKTIQAVVCSDDWMRAKGFSTEIGYKKDDEDDVSSVAF